METFLGGIALAALTGIAVVAYRHPRAYRKVFIPLTMLLGAALIGATLWDAAVSQTWAAVAPKIPFMEHLSARTLVDNVKVMNVQLVLGYLGLNAYLFLLFWLPRILSDDQPPKPKHDKKR